MDGLEKCQAKADQAFSIPPDYYVSPEVARVEEQVIFRKSWLGVGRADMVKSPGDFVALDIAGQALVLLRDKKGVLRVFANSCRHRSARLVEGDGHCQGLRCPFHSWLYHLDGRLAAAPKMEAATGFCREDYNLIQYRAEERLGFVFVCLDAATEDLDQWLGDLAQLHAPWPLSTLVTTRRQELTVNCNWKAFLEVFNEYYHLPFVHRDSIDDVYALPDPASITIGAYASQFGTTEGTGGLLQTEQDRALPPMPGLKGREAHGVRYSWVFPNTTFAAGTDALWVYEAYPKGPDQCHVVQTACFPPETLELPKAEARVASYHDRLDAALAEDVPALVNQHRGLSSPDARQGRFQPLLEPSVAAFAHWYSKVMAPVSKQL